VYVSTTVFITQGNYIGYIFRLLNSHLQAYSLQVKSQNPDDDNDDDDDDNKNNNNNRIRVQTVKVIMRTEE